MNTEFITTRDPEYDIALWNAMHLRPASNEVLSKGTNSRGNLKLPDFTAGKFYKALTKESLFRSIGTVVCSDGDNLLWAYDCGDTAAWVSENQSINMYEGFDDIKPCQIESHKLSTIVRFQNEYINTPGFDLEKHLFSHMTKAISRAEEYGFINGNGISEPHGLLANEGGAEIGATTTALTYEDIINLYFSVKPEYRKNGKWLMNDETAYALRTIKDKNGNYIWNHSNDTILGKEVIISNYMPSSDKPIAFGDFSYYWIFDRDQLSIKILKELFSDHGQIGYLGFEFLDGRLVRPEAVKVLKIA